MHRSVSKAILAASLLAMGSASVDAGVFFRVAPGPADGDGDTFAIPTGINSSGLVVGNLSTATADDFDNAFISPPAATTSARTSTALGPVTGGADSTLFAVGSTGVAVGGFVGPQSAQFPLRAVTYTAATGFVTIGTNPTVETLTGINSANTFVGYGETSANAGTVPIVGTVGSSTFTTLPFFPGTTATGSEATGINTAGLVVGYGPDSTGRLKLFTYNAKGTATSLTNLGTLANPNGGISGIDSSVNIAINDAGTIAGTATLNASTTGAFTPYSQAFRNVNGQFTSLSGLSTATSNTTADGVNNQGITVGSATLANGSLEAVLWMPGSTTAVPLQSYFTSLDPTDAARYTLSDATAINDSDVIVGTINADPDPEDDGVINNGGFVLDLSSVLAPTTVPEPASLGLLVPAAALVLRRRRRMA